MICSTRQTETKFNNKMPAKKKTKFCSNFAPIDIFGSPVEFNINGDTSYKTVVGCFWTLVMVGLMLGASIYYFLQYLDTTNVKLTSQTVQQTAYPTMDFKKSGLFMTLLFQKGPQQFLRPSDVERYFTVEAVQISKNSTSDSSTRERTIGGQNTTKIEFTPCRSAGIKGEVKGKTIKGKTSMALSDFGYCSKLNNNETEFTLSGDEDSDLFKYVELRIFPCNGTFGPTDNSNNTKCALPNAYDDTIKFTDDEMKRIRSGLREYTVTVMLIDAAIEAVNYGDPVIYMMNGNYKYALTSLQQKTIGFYFKTVTVTTDIGIFSENLSEKSSYSVSEVIYDSLDRGIEDRPKIKGPGNSEETRPIPYVTFTFLSSNTKLEYTRTYLKILDVLGLVGGVSQVFTYVVLVLYAWYNSLRMEQEIINRTVLHINKDDDELEDWEKNRKMSMWDITKFHYFKSCQKKNPKYKLYKNCESQVEEKTDITKIIKAVTDIEVIKNALLSPAQAKLIRYTALAQPDEKADDKPDETAISAFDAIQKIKAQKVGENEINDRINKFILDNMPKEIGLVQIKKEQNIMESMFKSQGQNDSIGEENKANGFGLNVHPTVKSKDIKTPTAKGAMAPRDVSP